MNVETLLIADVEGERRVNPDELPLKIGSGPDCALRLPGPGRGAVAVLDMLDGAPFVQPVGQTGSIELNGTALTASRRLQADDRLTFFGSRVDVEVVESQLTLKVHLEDSAYITQPPEVDETDVGADETIAPTAFQRATNLKATTPEVHRSPLKAIVIVGFALLMLASYLLFSARSIQFEITPGEPDSVDIVGGWFRLPLGDRVLLRSGDYTVNVEKAGYYAVSQSFTVADEDSKTISLELRPLPGRLLVTTEPLVDALITVDNLMIGKAPYGPVELQPGEHSVRVQADRYLPFADVIQMPGLGRDELLRVQLIPRWSNVTVESEPSGATIYAGDQEIGTTPAVVELIEGAHSLSVVRDGFAAWDGSVVAKPNLDQTLPLIRLQPANARLQVNSIPRGANVTVDGRYRGQSPLSLSLSPGVDYAIGLTKAGYGSSVRRVRLQAAASDSITVDLSARTGRVTVNVSPNDATVVIDGRPYGQGTSTVNLSSAPHRIEVRKDGYQSWSRTITPRPGYPQTLSARLRSHEEIERAKIQTTQKTSQGQVLRRVEGGTFTMGASRSESGRRANEVLVPVTISRTYLIGTREVSNREFAAFRENHDSGSAVHAAIAGDNNPVANVTWADAVQYCNWLSALEGLTPAYEEKFGEWVPIWPLTNGYRLPTEAEWTWAIRYNGSQGATKFGWGDSMPPKKNAVNLADRSAVEIVPTIIPRYDDGFAASSPIGHFPPSRIGIHDGAGNVAEWVNDYYTVPTPGITTPLVDPLGPQEGSTNVIRGSSWRHAGETELRQSYRDHSAEPRVDVGFRIARTLE